jgi:hypothetical protein
VVNRERHHPETDFIDNVLMVSEHEELYDDDGEPMIITIRAESAYAPGFFATAQVVVRDWGVERVDIYQRPEDEKNTTRQVFYILRKRYRA